MFGAVEYIQNNTKQQFLVVDLENKIQELLGGLTDICHSAKENQGLTF